MYGTVKLKRRRPMAEINVVPYIDVMLVLLIIFMITAPLLTQGVKVDLPKHAAKNMKVKPQVPIIVTVDGKGNYYLNVANKPQRPINVHTLLTQVAAHLHLARERHQARDVLVKADRHVPYGRVMQAMVLLQKAGAPSVGLITDKGV